MAKLIIVPTGRHANTAAVAAALAKSLPDAAVFNPLAQADRAAELLSLIHI